MPSCNNMQEFFKNPTKDSFMSIVRNFMENRDSLCTKDVRMYETWIAAVVTNYKGVQMNLTKKEFEKMRKIVDNYTDFYKHYFKYLKDEINLEKLYNVIELMVTIFSANGDEMLFDKLIKITKDKNLDLKVRLYVMSLIAQK